jgi:uncharacterized UBP type Zn finger protein
MDFYCLSCTQELKTVHNSTVTVLTAIQGISINGDKEIGVTSTFQEIQVDKFTS